jgi:PAS domain S-box-containing protein
MRSSIFISGNKSSFAKNSRSMSKTLSLGAGALAIVYSFFIHYYFKADATIRLLSLILPVLYIVSFGCSFSKITNKKLYEIIFGVFVITSLILLYTAYCMSFNSEYIILMLAIFGVILVALPTTKQLLIYFGVTFIPLEVALFLSETSIGFTLLISLSFGAIFVLSYIISKQKNALSYRSSQNAKVLKTLINNTNDAIFLVDFYTNEIQDTNENTKDIFGLNDTEEFFTKHYYELFTEKGFIDAKRDKITQKMADDGYYQTDAMFRRKNGSNFLGRLHLSSFEALNKKYYLLQIKNIAVRKL